MMFNKNLLKKLTKFSVKKGITVGAIALMTLGVGGFSMGMNGNASKATVHADAFENALKHNPNAIKNFINEDHKDEHAQDVKYNEHMYGGVQGMKEHAKENEAFENSISNGDGNDTTSKDTSKSVTNLNNVDNDTNNDNHNNSQKYDDSFSSIDNELKKDTSQNLANANVKTSPSITKNVHTKKALTKRIHKMTKVNKHKHSASLREQIRHLKKQERQLEARINNLKKSLHKHAHARKHAHRIRK